MDGGKEENVWDISSREMSMLDICRVIFDGSYLCWLWLSKSLHQPMTEQVPNSAL